MNRSRLGALALAPLLAAAGLAAVPGPSVGAAPAAPAARTVTIRAENTDLSGSVRSSRASCRSEVPVVVFKQKGSRGGGDDRRFAMDTSGPDGAWDTGNTGTEGRFYARVAPSPGCQGDTSPTIRAERDD
ncbi:hypothetical protein [uncultured Nocardioides sp.]|uniref:hypothetical protein n=1 Tax=uncultured Nocardioides sp. TaxID=198441 RepID=UPI00261A38D5|nr:hypothetical protein [uncultured Nocardioides sp.]